MYALTFPLTIPDVPYEVTVYTSDMMGAGTSAHVYIVLYGTDGSTEEVLLADTSKKQKDSFKRGSVDQFVKEVSSFTLTCLDFLLRYHFTDQC